MNEVFNTNTNLSDLASKDGKSFDGNKINIRLYLTTLIKEKGASVNDNVPRIGHIGLVWENLIEFCELMDPADKQKIIHTCTKIDFKNGDIFHFLNYLVDGMLAAPSNLFSQPDSHKDFKDEKNTNPLKASLEVEPAIAKMAIAETIVEVKEEEEPFRPYKNAMRR